MTKDVPPIIAKSTRWAPIAKLSERLFDLPVWKVVTQHIKTVDPVMLEYLAKELDLLETEAWKRSQTNAEKRYLIERAYDRKRIVGTDAGLIQAAKEAGGEVKRIMTHAKFFPSSGLTPAEKNVWLSKFPELRIYQKRRPGTREVAMCGSSYPGATFFTGPGTAKYRARLRVTLVKNGQETELETTSTSWASAQKQVTNEITIPGKAGHCSFVGRPVRFVAATGLANRRITLRNIDLYNEPQATRSLRTVSTGFTPIDADGQMVSEIRPKVTGATFCGQVPRLTVGSQADYHVYLSVRLFDPGIAAVRARAACHIGFSRISMQPHLAIVNVACFGHRNPMIGRFAGQPIASSDHANLKRLIANLRLAKRFSDEVLINTKIFRPVVAGQIFAGEAMAGEFIK